MLKRTLLFTAAVLFVASVGMAGPKQAAGDKGKSWSGYVTDGNCATKGMKAVTNADCVKKCVDAGAKYVLYDPREKKVYQLDPQSAVADHATHHVKISGTLDGDTIHVDSVEMIASKAAEKPAS
ncbi:MAG TPA: hypothetical protein VJN21_04235 [Candidatus Acidoferrales bacterium]|nr:hypothetical protein [Candidatus Acidoferrales bacterium]